MTVRFERELRPRNPVRGEPREGPSRPPSKKGVNMADPFPMKREDLLRAYRTMRTIREFEERLHVDFARGDIPGFVHLYAGEEAAATGIMLHLNDGDRIASTHRGHGHCIAKGVDVAEMMKEIYGKKGGACQGKGGSMHIADLDRGMMGANGILGAGAPLACGAALAAKYRGKGEVAISFVGDGASNQGMFLESLNLAAVWNLPAIFVVENNGYAESTSRDYAVAVDSYVDRAAGFGLPGVTVDGTDFFGVYEGDQQTYRGRGEVEDLRANQDCIKKFNAQVVGAGVVKPAELEAIDREAKELIERAVTEAKAAPAPTAQDLLTDVYVRY